MGAAELDGTQVRQLEEPAVSIEIQRQLLRAIANIQYGSVEVVIHDSRIVQIEAREKIRFGGSKARV